MSSSGRRMKPPSEPRRRALTLLGKYPYAVVTRCDTFESERVVGVEDGRAFVAGASARSLVRDGLAAWQSGQYPSGVPYAHTRIVLTDSGRAYCAQWRIPTIDDAEVVDEADESSAEV